MALTTLRAHRPPIHPSFGPPICGWSGDWPPPCGIVELVTPGGGPGSGGVRIPLLSGTAGRQAIA